MAKSDQEQETPSVSKHTLEVVEKSRELANRVRDLRALRDEFKEIKKGFGVRIETAERGIEDLAGEIREGAFQGKLDLH